MIREEYLRRLIDSAWVDVYLSAGDGARIYWPWRMEPPWEATRSYRNACENYIIDSGPQRPSVKNKTVLDEAVRVDADMVLLADYFPFDKYEEILDPEDNPIEWDAYQSIKREFGDAYRATISSVKYGLELAESHPFDGEIIIPLQAPYAECYEELPGHERYSIGGLNKATDMERVNAAKAVRDVAPDVWLHGLGWGARDGLVAAVHDNPGLIDSVDYSTPVQSAIGGIDAGDERMSVVAARAGGKLIEDLRRFSPNLNDPPTPPRGEQLTVGDAQW